MAMATPATRARGEERWPAALPGGTVVTAGFEEVEAAVVWCPVAGNMHRLAKSEASFFLVRGKHCLSVGEIRTSGGGSRACGSNGGGVVLVGGVGDGGGGGEGARGLGGGGVSSLGLDHGGGLLRGGGSGLGGAGGSLGGGGSSRVGLGSAGGGGGSAGRGDTGALEGELLAEVALALLVGDLEVVGARGEVLQGDGGGAAGGRGCCTFVSASFAFVCLWQR